MSAPVITVSPGPRNAYTDPDSGLRYYRWQGRDLPSVTSIRRMAGLPHGLHQWSISQVISHAIDHWPQLTAQLSSGDPAQLKQVRHELRTAATAERDRAANLGTAVHDAAAQGRSPLDVSPDVARRLRQYLDWLDVSGAELLGSEFQVFHLGLGYAGSCDALMRFRDGSIWVIDYKTGKGVYSDHALQLIAYAMAEFVGADDVVDEQLSDLLHQVTGIGLLHLADDHWEFRSVRPDAATWSAFRGLLSFAIWSAANSSADAFTLAAREGREAAAA